MVKVGDPITWETWGKEVKSGIIEDIDGDCIYIKMNDVEEKDNRSEDK